MTALRSLSSGVGSLGEFDRFPTVTKELRLDAHSRASAPRSDIDCAHGAQGIESEVIWMPILDRALTFGRGPVDLVRWVQERVRMPASESQSDRTLVRKLARELADVIGSSGVADTIAFGIRDTIPISPNLGRITSELPARPYS